jgi:hypothetical protein
MRTRALLVLALSLLLSVYSNVPSVLLAQGPATATPMPQMATLSQEMQPNNRFSQANPIAANGTVSGTIDPVGEHDWFKFSADTPGALNLVITSVASNMNYAVQVWTANKDVLAGWQSAPRAGADTDATVDLPQAGVYYLELADSGDSAASAQPYQLQTTLIPANDSFGANNSFATAAPLTLNTAQNGFIFPRGEHDWFMFNVDTPGALHVLITSVAPSMNYAFQMWTDNKDGLTGWQGAPRAGADTDVTVDLPRGGVYYLELADSGDSADSTQPYQLQANFTAAPDVFGANNSFANAAALTLDVGQQGFIFPRGEHDWFSFQVPGRSLAHVLITKVPAELQLSFQTWNANKDVIAGWQGAPRAGADAEATLDLPKGGTYYLEVAQSGDSARSLQPYTLQISVMPGVDADEYNDRFANARPIALNADSSGSIVPHGYHGWYRVDIPGPGTLNVSLTRNPASMNMVGQVWNADKAVVCGWQGAPRAGADAQFTCPVKEGGSYYLEVADSGDAHSSPDAYHVTVVFSKPS